ncbi:TRAP transporter small permease subunit [Salinarimonas ramus]|uniref:TRAP transporter small permease protein n=1 Tax=Salinarimonas ramus TaxID=690164 RepID=A0A917QCD3_9HYPH|nr:TRAP transporter small permease subunit [Salinarimonas ramus]GGK43575.1 C4-dicarboxylate ABC transporter [Salinarimonas ramus]
MSFALRLAHGIDALNERIARLAAWLVLAAVVISAGNAISRKAFSLSSNAWLELQWYLFGAVFLLGASWTLKRNEHVRIDVLSSRLAPRTRAWIDVVGHALFLLPFAFVHATTAVPFFLLSWRTGEVSPNAGGLPLWPAKLLVLVGFTMLLAQGVSELVKKIAVLRGALPDDADDGRAGPGLTA